MLDHRIGAKTKRFAVLGESLGHTWSPVIHNSLFSAAKLDAIYLPVTIPREQLSSAVDVLRSCFGGFNVTIPYKERIIPLLDEVDDAVRACGAVNTVENRDGRLIGHVTDGLGMLAAIEEAGAATRGQRVLILGGGGAARVAGYEFLIRSCTVTLALRNAEKAERLAGELAQTQPDGDARIHTAALSDILGEYDLLINCTPVGMYPNVDASPVGGEVVARCGAVFDAVYNPRETRLLAMAKARGIPAIEGLGMLYYQAVAAERFWLGELNVSPEEQRRIYLELREQL